MPQVDQAEPDPLFIYYPNGSVMGVALFVWDAIENKYVKWDGSGGGSGGGAVTIADGADVTQGTIADAKVTGDVAGTVNAHLRGINTSIDAINTKTPALGQALAAASVPIVLTAAQLTTLTPPAAITGFATETTLAATLATQGATTGAAVITDANGTIQQYLRGLVKLFITSIRAISQAYTATASFTITLASLASSATWVAGRESTAVSVSGNVTDHIIGGKITAGTSPAASSVINIYLVVPVNDTPLYPDVFDGTDSDETVTSENVRNSAITFAACIVTDNTSDRTYWVAPFSVKKILGYMPATYGLFVSQSTGANLNATGSNHALYYTPIYVKSTQL
jgi:hypothetical protein